MGQGANNQLLTNSGVAQGRSGQQSQRGGQDYGFLFPQLENEATNPQGYTPQQLAYMNTAAQQSAGGSTGAVTGQANLEAARTRNKGGFQGAIGSGTRQAQRQLSTNALQIQTNQANLQQQQRQQALQQLQQLYGVDESTALGYLGASNDALKDENAGSGINNNLFDQALLQSLKGGISVNT